MPHPACKIFLHLWLPRALQLDNGRLLVQHYQVKGAWPEEAIHVEKLQAGCGYANVIAQGLKKKKKN